MATRTTIATVVLAGVLAAACSDAFSVEDVVGTWDVVAINGSDVPGDAWIRAEDGDSTEIPFDDFYFRFLAASDCSITMVIAGIGAVTTDECEYAITAQGDVSITVGGDYVIDGSVDGTAMTLTDEEANLYVLWKPEDAGTPVVSVTVTPAVDSVRSGESIQLTATPKDVIGRPLRGRSVVWTSDDEAVAHVNSQGLVTGVSGGVATITATSEGREGTAEVTVWVGVTGAWVGTLDVSGGPCQLDLSITEAGTGAITGTSLLYAPCYASPFAVTGTNNTAGVTDSVALGFDDGSGVTFSFAGIFDGDSTMTGSVFPGPYPANFTRQSLTPAPPGGAAVRSEVPAAAGAPLWPRRDPGGR
jgi:hypothetical protein